MITQGIVSRNAEPLNHLFIDGHAETGSCGNGYFAVAHLDPVALIPTFILGCLLAYMFQRSNSVWPGVILHFLVNAFGLCAAYAATQFPGIIPT